MLSLELNTYYTWKICKSISLHIQTFVKWLRTHFDLTPSPSLAGCCLAQWKGHTHPNLPELAVAQALYELQWLPRNLPHIFGFDRQVSEPWHPFVARDDQATAKPCCPLWARTQTQRNIHNVRERERQKKSIRSTEGSSTEFQHDTCRYRVQYV